MKNPLINYAFLAVSLVGCRMNDSLVVHSEDYSAHSHRHSQATTNVYGNVLPKERGDELDRVEREGSLAELKAERLFKEGRLKEAEAACMEVNRIFGSSGVTMASDVAHLLGRIRIRQGRYADAVAFMEPNLNTDTGMSMDLALCELKVGNVAKARALYDPSFITGYNSAFGDTTRFLPDVRTPERLEGAILWTKGVALSNVSRADEATDSYAAALKLLPRNALLAARLGLAAENAGRHAESLAAYRIVQTTGDAFMRKETKQNAERAEYRARAAGARTSG